ncbi:DHH family phosphoesterase [Aeropyrum camini]|uniref:Predicted phosphohydrolase n=1 Tax=Aeropyrum camini SY1 = JCM 12091 TaxID=1198449 RepID=U3TBZ9_9CREN|nr:DHHA1 domain-containing protein [Aeropyrum camini]BAN89565.1 predicted phosphohydrolase [Aeropyrum camini SY1 = JCM 12091]
MGDEFNHLYIITHTDLDGIGAGAVAVRLLGRVEGGYTVVFAEPYNVHNAIEDILDHLEKGDLVVISDLGANRESLPKAAELLASAITRGVTVKWFDHHVWSDYELDMLRKAGVEVTVDNSTCAAGVVARYLTPDSGDRFIEAFVDAVCSADLWRWTHPLSGKLFRVVGERNLEMEWKHKVLAKFASGTMWDEELEAKLEDYVNDELKGYTMAIRNAVRLERNALRIASTYKNFRGPPSSSMIGALLLHRYAADIAVIVRSDGGLSLRSRKINVQPIARALGGGGHPKAAGAKIEIPLLIKLGSRLYPKILSLYTARLVAAKAAEIGLIE